MPFKTEILETQTPELLRRAVQRAATVLRRGGLVALPTETVYGLAANALDPAAVGEIFTVKGRPAHNPIIVHVSGRRMARRCVTCWPTLADELTRAFWPGPLTLVLPRAAVIPEIVVGRGDTVGLRWPSHPVMQAVIRACGFPLAAPSANLSTRLSPTTARHVLHQLGGLIPLVIDGGSSRVGIESTVLDLTVSPPRILRPGMIHEQALLAVCGRVASHRLARSHSLKSPGLLRKHYAPRAHLLVCRWRNEADLRRRMEDARLPLSHTHVIAHKRIPSPAGLGRVAVVPHDPQAFARALYAELHDSDDAGAAVVLVEAPPRSPEWRAIADRLRRAAAGS